MDSSEKTDFVQEMKEGFNSAYAPKNVNALAPEELESYSFFKNKEDETTKAPSVDTQQSTPLPDMEKKELNADKIVQFFQNSTEALPNNPLQRTPGEPELTPPPAAASVAAVEKEPVTSASSPDTISQQFRSVQQGQVIQETPTPPKDDLLSQIIASDPETAPKKKKQSLGIQLLVHFMRFAFWVDAYKTAHPGIFVNLKKCWALFIFILISSFFITGYFIISVYLKFPAEIRKYLTSEFISANIGSVTNFSSTSLEIKNIKDRKGRYTIKSVLLRYTLPELLKNHIKSATLEGVELTVTEGKEGFDFGILPWPLLSAREKSPTDLRIDSISVQDSIINIKGRSVEVPVSFTATGVYADKISLNSQFSLERDSLKLSGQFGITELTSKDRLQWNLSILSGKIPLISNMYENIVGTVKFTTEKGTLKRIDGDIKLGSGLDLRQISVALSQKSQEGFSGGISYKKGERNTNRIDLTLDVKQLKFLKGIHHIYSDKEMKLQVAEYNTKNLSVNNAILNLKGELNCPNFACSYKINAPTNSTIEQIKWKNNGEVYQTAKEMKFSLLPDKAKTNFVWNKKGRYFSLLFGNLDYQGYKTTGNNTVEITSKFGKITGTYLNNYSDIKLAVQDLYFLTPDFRFFNANLTLESGRKGYLLRLQSPKFELLNKKVFATPAGINFLSENGNTKAFLTLENNVVQASFVGKSDILNGYFQGELYVPPFELGKIRNLQKFSDIIPDFVTSATGTIGLMGSMEWINNFRINGPMLLLLDNVMLHTRPYRFKNINGVVLLTSLSPFITAPNQQIHIQSAEGILPIQNVSVTFHSLANQLVVDHLFANLSGINLMANNATLSYKNKTNILVLRNGDFNLHQLTPDLQNSNLTFEGRASVNIPMYITNDAVFVRNAEVKTNNLTLFFNEADTAVANLFPNRNSPLTSRYASVIINSFEAGNNNLLFQAQIDNIQRAGRPFKHDWKDRISNILKTIPETPVPAEIENRKQLFY